MREYRLARLGLVALGCLALANCTQTGKLSRKIDPKYGVAASPRVVQPGEPVPKGGGVYRVGRPYTVAGRTYVPTEDRNYTNEGLASWYGDDFHGRLTANGEVFDMHSLSAAHPTLPMPSYVRVTNMKNQRSVVVRVNDRGPYHGNREIDLSQKTAQVLDFHGHGVARVRVEYIGPAPLGGTDDRTLLATYREGSPAPAPSNVMLASAQRAPSLASLGPIRGGVPVPTERPYGLNDQPAMEAEAPATYRTASYGAPRLQPTEMTSVQRQELSRYEAAPRLEAPRYEAPAPRTPAPVAAYAPAPYDASRSLVTGRGLY
jgi:rare lipoprotein A